jgi:crotonobetainyl-CoA:carnitine CoA-transferase CaiB-like acyl-CoA transferase
MSASPRPLAGMRVLEFSHMVMGPVVGTILVELGAEVIKVEPLTGDSTRELQGSGAGYFPMYNRNKQSISLDLKDPRGRELARRLAARSDVLIENFRPGVMDGLGLSYESLRTDNPRLIYCSLKGFLAGPYANRTALDEVAQMMGGLAYMTGPPGRPLRAGASVVDVTGGMFGVIGILAALEQRHSTGMGQKVTSALFETTAFLVGQHMAQQAVTGQAAKPMPVRVSAWAIYDVFEVAAGDQVFIGVVSDAQWQTFCTAFGFEELGRDPRLRSNRQRVAARADFLPLVRQGLAALSKAELLARLEKAGLPFAPISRPEDLFDDPQLLAGGGLMPTRLPDGSLTHLPILPLQLNAERPTQGGALAGIGEHTHEILAALGLPEPDIEALQAARIIRSPPESIRNAPDSMRNAPDSIGNAPDSMRNAPGSIGNAPDSMRNAPDSIRNLQDFLR